MHGIGGALRARWTLARSALRRAWITRHPSSFARLAEPDDAELGLLGESWAARELARAGWKILGRRVRSARAEVDLVAREGTTLVLVEVKTAREEPVPRPRGSPAVEPRWRPGERYGAASRARAAELARLLSAHACGRARVDLVEVFLDRRTGRLRLEHHVDVARRTGDARASRR